MNIRTRIAPSPTGTPHIGTAFIALFNYAFAKRHGGQFILRIEDTDQARSTRESEREIMHALSWLGLRWDEGPDQGGPFGPYRQSERTDIYQHHAKLLIKSGHAYPCFCSMERLAELRRTQAGKEDNQGYDGLCAELNADEAQKRALAGEQHVIRLRVPKEGECVMQDELRGEIHMPWTKVDHQILMKADGFPTYHLANVVDDHLMQITHVIRGEEWINSLPKHLLLYQAFGWQAPQFFHLPLLRNPDKSKLSKRKNPVSILYYQRAGILSAALINYLGLLAYSFEDGRETFTLDELAATFDIKRVSLGGPVFDIQKLQAFNGRCLRAMPPEKLLGKLREWGLNDETWLEILPLAQPRLNQLADLLPMAAFLFADRPAYEPDLLLQAGLKGERAVELIKTAQWEIEKNAAWNTETIRHIFEHIADRENLKLKQILPPFFVAIAGTPVALPVFDSMRIIGRDMTLRRLQYALEGLEKLGFALKKDKLKAFEKAYQSRYASNPVPAN